MQTDPTADLYSISLSHREWRRIGRAGPTLPVIAGPLRSSKGNQFGAITIEDGDAVEYRKARDYIAYGSSERPSGDPQLRTVFLSLEDSDFPTTIHLLNHGRPGMDYVGQGAARVYAVGWPARRALMTTDGKGISPALLLGHELTHIYHDQVDPHAGAIRGATFVPLYHNAEEELTIAAENTAARNLGEGVRSTHLGGLTGTELLYSVHACTARTTAKLSPYEAAKYFDKFRKFCRETDPLKKPDEVMKFEVYRAAEERIARRSRPDSIRNFLRLAAELSVSDVGRMLFAFAHDRLR